MCFRTVLTCSVVLPCSVILYCAVHTVHLHCKHSILYTQVRGHTGPRQKDTQAQKEHKHKCPKTHRPRGPKEHRPKGTEAQMNTGRVSKSCNHAVTRLRKIFERLHKFWTNKRKTGEKKLALISCIYHNLTKFFLVLHVFMSLFTHVSAQNVQYEHFDCAK